MLVRILSKCFAPQIDHTHMYTVCFTKVWHAFYLNEESPVNSKQSVENTPKALLLINHGFMPRNQ